MSDSKVVYELSLNDKLTPRIKEADQHVNKFEHSLGSAAHKATDFGKELVASLGVTFALFKGWQFVESGIEGLHKLHAAEAQVEAGLKSTHEAAGLTFEELEKSAISLASQFKYSRAEIFDLQSILVTFPSITKETFGGAEQAVVDMATRMKQDLQTTAVQVGKALQDPIRGITALRRVGVNFNETQTKLVKHMVETGHAAQAQAYILNELKTEFGGSAKAAANADPYFRYNKLMGSIKLSVAETANKLLHFLVPALEWVAGAIKDSIQWMKEHKDLLQAMGIAAGVIAGGFLIYYGVINTVTIATRVWTAVQWLLNAAMTANPLGILIVAIGVAIGAIVYAYHKFAAFRAMLFGVWATVKEFGAIVGDIFKGLWHIIHGVFTLNPKEITSGFEQSAGAMLNSGKRLATAFKSGFDEGMADFNKDNEKKVGAVEAPKKEKKGLGAAPETMKEKGLKASSSGTKNIKIDIKIGNLIDKFSVNTTNIKDGYDKIREHVTAALVSAVNDSQIVAGE